MPKTRWHQGEHRPPVPRCPGRRARLRDRVNPFTKHCVIHYCVPNMASRVARTASIAVSNILTPILLKAGNTGSIERLIFEETGLRSGIYAYKGSLTNQYLGERYNMKWTDIDLLMTFSI